MKKLEIGLFALSVLVGSYFGSWFGMAIAVCIFMTVDGVIDEFRKHNSSTKKELAKKEDK